jgi:hypothetical protein
MVGRDKTYGEKTDKKPNYDLFHQKPFHSPMASDGSLATWANTPGDTGRLNRERTIEHDNFDYQEIG